MEIDTEFNFKCSQVVCRVIKECVTRSLTGSELALQDDMISYICDRDYRNICKVVGANIMNAHISKYILLSVKGAEGFFHFDHCKSNKFIGIFMQHEGYTFSDAVDVLQVSIGVCSLNDVNLQVYLDNYCKMYLVNKDWFFPYSNDKQVFVKKCVSILMEYTQRNIIKLPFYTVTPVEDRWKSLCDLCLSNGMTFRGVGIGNTKQEAKEIAARKILEQLIKVLDDSFVKAEFSIFLKTEDKIGDMMTHNTNMQQVNQQLMDIDENEEEDKE